MPHNQSAFDADFEELSCFTGINTASEITLCTVITIFIKNTFKDFILQCDLCSQVKQKNLFTKTNMYI